MSNESQAREPGAENDPPAEQESMLAGAETTHASPDEVIAPADGEGATGAQSVAGLAEQNWNKYLRAVAEMDNLRKRSARDIENARKFGAERLAAALLPVVDSMEAGLKAAADADPTTLNVDTLLEGERATLRLLEQALEAAGIAAIEPAGEPFDPVCHEAISLQASATAEPDSVLVVVQKGYSLNDRILRPARVIVSQAPVEQG
jgi:molecular chaperone GrpE